MRLVDLANLYDKPIAPATWEAIRREAPASCRRRCRRRRPAAIFFRCWAIPPGSGPLLRDLHDARHPGALHSRVRPRPRTAAIQPVSQVHGRRALPAGGRVCHGLVGRPGARWDASIAPSPQKHVLHLALLIHDLGKGYLEDHREVGLEDRRPTRPSGWASRRRRPKR